jgi:hypothetical protein
MIVELIKYKWISFKRIKMTPYLTPPDSIALIILILIITSLVTIISFDNSIVFEHKKYFNFTYVNILTYLGIFFFESYIENAHTPNYNYIKIIVPLRIERILFNDLLLEICSYKFIFIFSFLINYFYFFDETLFFHWINYLGLFSVFVSYINICIIMRLFKDISRKNKMEISINSFKLLFLLLFVILTINSNCRIIRFDNLLTLIYLLFLNGFVFLICTSRWLYININRDKV